MITKPCGSLPLTIRPGSYLTVLDSRNKLVISADTAVEEAAMTWIMEMTDASVQINNEKRLGRLPVSRTIYDNDDRLTNLLPARGAQTFPNQASLAIDPKLPLRMKQLEKLWQSYATGQITLEDWKSTWTETLSELQNDD